MCVAIGSLSEGAVAEADVAVAVSIIERVEDFRASDLGEEAKRSEIDREDRDVMAALGNRLGHRQQRTVAAEHDDVVDLLRDVLTLGDRANASRRTVEDLRRFRRPDCIHAALAQPLFEADQRVAGGGQTRFDGDTYLHDESNPTSAAAASP
jgi:hypothetical protein